MDTATDVPRGGRRARPSEADWDDAMTALLAAHAAHGWLPLHACAAVGDQLGVAPRSVETRYGLRLAALEADAAWRLGPAEVELIAAAADFPEAHRRLVLGGIAPAFPVVERAIWRDVSRSLVGLRVAERRRRQALADAGVCAVCGAAPTRAA